tara:strand:- start:272 stop:394 length:123 start_codon:yes stop_codon:yes gene_type:complete
MAASVVFTISNAETAFIVNVYVLFKTVRSFLFWVHEILMG